MKLTLRQVPTPPLDQLTPLQREQIGPLLQQADDDAELIELFDVLDESGAHLWDMHLFCGDDGRIHQRSTMNYVASFSQGGATGSADAQLTAALNDALDAWRTQRTKNPKSTKKKKARR